MIAAHTGLWLKVSFLQSSLFLQFVLDDLLRVVVRVRVRNIFVSKMIVQMILLWTSLLHSRRDYHISSDKGYEPSIFRSALANHQVDVLFVYILFHRQNVAMQKSA